MVAELSCSQFSLAQMNLLINIVYAFVGTGVCAGNATYNVTDAAPALLVGDGSVTGDGTFGSQSGTFVGTGNY